jgi:mRNA-degrading endonuclease toxin of MazEF toxin-antitoxin module
MTIYADEIEPIPCDRINGPIGCLPVEIMDDVGDSLERAIFAAIPLVPRQRPAKHPQRGQVRFADLQIDGQPDKPVLVISSESYSQSVEYEFVIACRVTSTVSKIHDFDVAIAGGKVVCSDIYSVPSYRLSDRTIREALAPGTRSQIDERVRRILGLPQVVSP